MDNKLGARLGGGRDAKQTELEEEKASDYPNIREEANMNPDVDLSYLDEKVQVLFGDFQKKFEGGVSEENLGSKYGSYGSFLPTYQGSPSSWSHPRIPQKVQSSETPGSPNNLPIEVAPTTDGLKLIKENWIACDRCGKWRLLPHYVDLHPLPREWLCSMLNWVPGMNSCEISEEITTQVATLLTQQFLDNRQTLPDEAAAQGNSAEVQ